MTTDNSTPRSEGDVTPADATPAEERGADRHQTTPEVPAEPELVEPSPVPAVAPEPPVDAAPEPAPTTEQTTAPERTAATEQAPEPAADTVAAPQVVYVDAPQRPKKRGTRGVGVAVVLLSTGVFTLLYALATVALALALRPEGLNGFGSYLASAPFFVPVLVFAGAHLLLVIVANRAGWWMHVLGGFLVAVLVWVAFLGAALIAAGALGATAAQQQAVVLQQLVNPLGIIAAVLAREIPIWVGGIVARRGRTQTARNAEAQAAYERDLAAHRASVQPAAPAS
ncbi:hypothetical protein [Microcella sp.]|uniref:hypothetical protein n=1 Tax=Microcella sp. TaxID=1913979 RepID=UPI003918A159